MPHIKQKKSEAKGRKEIKGAVQHSGQNPQIHGVDIIFWTPIQIEVTEEEEEEEEGEGGLAAMRLCVSSRSGTSIPESRW